MAISGDAIANIVLQQFEKLPQKRKPQIRSNGLREWVPLCGIVAQDGDSLRCIVLSTGMKCLPASKIPYARGLVLHDWHAEVLAIRSLNRLLLEECSTLTLKGAPGSTYLRRRTEEEITESHFQPFTLREDIKLHMYCSEAPCGDASMELIMAAQNDSTPWKLPTPLDTAGIPSTYSSQSSSEPLPGRAYFSALGIVRRKPARPDAPITLSKSCSDKLSLKQCTSLLSSTTSLLISPENAYLKTLVLPQSQYSATACQRAFSNEVNVNRDDDKIAGRMEGVKRIRWKDTGYRFEPFEIRTTSQEFAFSRRCGPSSGQNMVPSNLSVVWITAASFAARGVEESLIGGVLQGQKAFISHGNPLSGPLPPDTRAASRVSRIMTWHLAASVASVLSVSQGSSSQSHLQEWAIANALVPKADAGMLKAVRTASYTYRDVKESDILTGRRIVKEDVRQRCLKGWVRNDRRGEEFTICSM